MDQISVTLITGAYFFSSGSLSTEDGRERVEI